MLCIIYVIDRTTSDMFESSVKAMGKRLIPLYSFFIISDTTFGV